MWVERLLKGVTGAAAVGAALVIVVSTVADVGLRYGFGRPIHGAYDVVETLMVVFVFSGLTSVFLGCGHIVIDVVDHLTGPMTRRVLTRFGDVAGVVALGLMLFAMIEPAMQAYGYGDRKLELGLKLWVIWAAAIGFGGCALLAAMWMAWRGGRR